MRDLRRVLRGDLRYLPYLSRELPPPPLSDRSQRVRRLLVMPASSKQPSHVEADTGKGEVEECPGVTLSRDSHPRRKDGTTRIRSTLAHFDGRTR